MFFNKYTKKYSGDILEKGDLEETANKIEFLQKVKYDLLNKSKQILRSKNVVCNNIHDFNELTEEINKYDFQKQERRPRFDGNVIDLRDEVQDGEILLLVKAGAPLKFNITTRDGSKFTVEWQENGILQKTILASGGTFNKNAPATGIDSVDGTFKYTIYRIYSPGAIHRFTGPWVDYGKGMSWFVSKGVHFSELWLNPGSTNAGHSYKDLEYIDLLDGGVQFIRAIGCDKLKEIEADYIQFNERFSADYIFYDCKKLERLPKNSIFKSYNFINAFYNCESLLELPNIDLSSSYNNQNIFRNCKSITNIKNNTIKINKNSNCQDMFNGCTSLLELPNITYGDEELGEGTNLSYAFMNCTAATKMPSSLNLSYCRLGVLSMFSGCSSIIDGPSEILLYNNLSDNIQYSVIDMFRNCTSLRSITGTITSANVNSCSNMFRGCTSLKKAPKCMFTNTLSCDYMYEGCSTLVTPPDIIDYPKAITSIYMFAECNLLQSAPNTITLNNCTNASYMFNNCKSMINGPTIINLPVSLNNRYMFQNCSSLVNFGKESVPIVFSDYADNSNMFLNCSSLKVVGDIEGGQNFSSMFSGAKLEKHPAINTSSNSVTFSNMFNNNAITAIDMAKINAPNVYSMASMFAYCPIEGDYVIDLSNFTKAMFFDYMLRDSKISSLTLTLPENTVSTIQLLASCLELKSAIINIPSTKAFVNNIFSGCNYLQSIELNGLFLKVEQISNFTSTFLKTFKVNAPNWITHTDHSWNFYRFSTLETCDIHVDINNYIQIINNKKLTDINLTLNYDSGIKNNVVITLTGNALTEEALNKIMTNLPDINLIEKVYDDLSAELYIANNPGTATCNTSIATNKGWIVYTS